VNALAHEVADSAREWKRDPKKFKKCLPKLRRHRRRAAAVGS
jgi:hypothetical protein